MATFSRRCLEAHRGPARRFHPAQGREQARLLSVPSRVPPLQSQVQAAILGSSGGGGLRAGTALREAGLSAVDVGI